MFTGKALGNVGLFVGILLNKYNFLKPNRNDYRKMTMLVTGGAGFIGANFATNGA